MAVSDLNKARKVKQLQEEKRSQARARQKFLIRETEKYGRMDTAMLILTVLLICYGLIMLFSASMSSGYADWGDPLHYVKNQLKFTVLGFGTVLIFAKIFPVRVLRNYNLALFLYAGVTLVLALVMVMGQEGDFGGMRWIRIGGFKFQPSEPAKLAVIYCLSNHFYEWRKRIQAGKFQTLPPRKQLGMEAFWLITVPALAMGFWMILIVIQPHLSGFVIMGLLSLSIFLAAGIPWRIWARGLMQLLPIVLVFALIVVMAFPMIKNGQSFFDFVGEKFSHVTTRFELYENPDEASEDAIRQIKQARYALGSGGLLGKGLGMGQQKSGFLPMVYNDYILPSVGEELGFVGTVSVIILFMLYFLLGMRITLNASSLFYALLAWGSTILITIQAFLNIAVAAQVIPSTGISLPFFSYGGSAHIFFLFAAGLILAVSRSGQKADPELKKILSLQAQSRELQKGQGI